MKTILRNFISVLRRFKMASALNILGLSIAFAAFIVIMMQITYDLSFNKSIKDADLIYRMEADLGGRRAALSNKSYLQELVNASPHIVASTMIGSFESDEITFAVEQNGAKKNFTEKAIYAFDDYPDFFSFAMVEGSSKALEDPEKVLLPESMAQKIFGGEPALDQLIIMGNTSLTVGGVYKDFPDNCSVSNCLIRPKNKNEEEMGFSLQAYIKLDKPDAVQGLRNDILPRIDASRLEQLANVKITFHLTPLKDIHFDTDIEYDLTQKTSRQTIWILIAIAFVILVIAGINFTNYNMALTPLRIKSINTQKVLGASVGSLRRTLLFEAVGLCALAWVLSIGLVYLLSLTSVSSLLDADMALAGHLPLIGATLVVALLLGFFAGLYPSYYITSFAPALVLKGSFGLSPQGRSLRNSLMGVQFVASFVLIVAALFMYLQNNYMYTKSVGYNRDQIIVTDINDRLNETRDAFVNELTSQAGISDVSFSDALVSGGDNYSLWVREIKDKKAIFQVVAIDVNFLKMMGVEVYDGRDYAKSDQNDTIRTEYFIFNRRAKEDFGLAVGDKIIDQLDLSKKENDAVIGFIPDVNIASLRRSIEPMAFRLIKSNNYSRRNWAYIKVEAGSDIYAAMNHVKASLQKISPDYPFKTRFFNEVVDNLYTKERSLTSLITWFSLIAILISVVGVFGMAVFESEYKRKEIGIRKVLGSTTSEILAMFNERYVKILVICFVIAAPIAWYAINGWLQNFAYKTPMYWWVFALSFLTVTMITTATVTFQSWQVANANPVDSIKTE